MLALARRLPEAQSAFRRAEIGGPLGHDLFEKTLLLVGHGGSAQRVEAVAEAFGMTVRATRSKTPRSELLALLAEADFVSLHCPLNDQTRGLIDREALEAVKPGAFLVNCARGPIVERAALEAALETGRLGGAGLDVFWREPWDPEDPLFARDDVVTLPHVAGSTQNAFAGIADVVAENVRRLRTGQPLLHRVA